MDNPAVIYEKDSDRVIVKTRNCPTKEVKINDILSLLAVNRPAEFGTEYVGFIIFNAGAFLREHGLPYEEDVDLLHTIDAIMRIYPCPAGYQDEIYRLLINYKDVRMS